MYASIKGGYTFHYFIIMKKTLFIILSFALLYPSMAQESGIQFFHGSWDEAVAKAKQENKKIFIDFFTEWCGPCLNMALTVFPLPQVGEVYNRHFVCMKIDAEKGTGIELAKKYGVHSYPNYVFVDPQTGDMIHRSGGNKPAADFMADAKGALNPKLSSIYLAEKYNSGNYDADFLIDYIRGQKIAGNRNTLKDFEKLIGMGCRLTDAKVWALFVECINGYDNAYIKQVSADYSQFVELFGKDEVDNKLAEATAYAPVAVLQDFCDFEGKDYNLKLASMSQLFREDKFDEAWAAVDKLIADTTIDQRKFVKQLSFYTRVSPTYGNPDLTFEQLAKKIRYTRYVAYNMYDRDDAHTHYAYALALEYLIQRSLKENKQIPADLLETPAFGKPEYSMRHPQLKQKPNYKRK